MLPRFFCQTPPPGASGVLSHATARPALAHGQDAAVLKDLTAVIALNGQPCGQVVSAVRQGDNHYVATCKDGNRYLVYNPEYQLLG